jgi:type 2 lantibiotic biosynthesis protein LanM
MLTDDAYRRAFTLRERAAAIRGHMRPMLHQPGQQLGVPLHTPIAASTFPPTSAITPAQRRTTRWQDQCSAGNAERFVQRLAAEQLSLEDLPLLLDSEALETDRLTPPITLVRWPDTSASEQVPAAVPRPPHTPAPDASGPHQAFHGFLFIAAPQLQQAQARLLRALRLLPGLRPLCHSLEQLTELASSALASDIAECVSKVLILEVNVMRLRGELKGETSDERFQHFLRTLDSDAARSAIFNEYPVLLRTIEQRADQWYQHALEVLQRLATDRHAIETHLLNGATLGTLTEIAFGAGDKHHKGRCVTILAFDSGHHVVYKPRSLAVDLAFQRLVDWTAMGIGDHTWRQPAHLPCGAYGWSEFVAHRGCANTEDVTTFYRRLGAQLALLFALDATDMHLENVMAQGDTPVLVDLEALFHPRLDEVAHGSEATTMPPDGGWSAYYDSVMRVGLLPSWSYHNIDGEAIELSGIGGMADQLLPDEQPTFSAIGQDTMCIVRQRARLPKGKNQPYLAGQHINPAAYADAIVRGFRAAYLHLIEHREELLRSEGPLAPFRHVDVRAVFRHTKVYATLLRDAHHPDLLRDAIDRDIHFDALWRAVETRPWFDRLVPHELSDLQLGDVPHFTTRPASTSVWSSDGTEIPNFFTRDAFERVQSRLQALNSADCDRQCWFIQAALAALATDTHNAPLPVTVSHRKKRALGPLKIEEQARNQARQIADRLIHLAVQRDDDANWLGVSLVNEKHWSLQPLGDDLYNGRLGVALFLLECDRLLGHPEARALASKTLESCARRMQWVVDQNSSSIERQPQTFRGSAFHGHAGEAFILAHAAGAWSEPRYAALAESLLEYGARDIANDDQLDVIAGVAGYLLVSCALLDDAQISQVARERITEQMQHAGQRLLQRAEQREEGWAWTTRIDSSHPLTGFSHGASGIALALHRAGRRLGRADFVDAAHQAVRYERHAYGASEERWPDYRRIAVQPTDGGWPSMCAWCHGAPGIGLSRMAMLADQSDAQVVRDLQSDLACAVRDTVLLGFTGNHSLCHGMLGNYALLHDVARTNVSAVTRHESDDIAMRVLDSIDRMGVQCGIPRGIETPGLMTGLAGVGLGLLKMSGDHVIDVLTLTLPKRPSP